MRVDIPGLSDAILLGSVGTEQGYGPGSVHSSSNKKCAMGAALFAVGACVSSNMEGLDKITEYWPWTRTYVDAPCTIRGEDIRQKPVYSIIWQLNDKAHWTRPQIAAWVATLERTYDMRTERARELQEVEP